MKNKYIFKDHNAQVVNHIFQSLLVTYLILLLIEQIWTGVVSLYLNLNYLLIAVIISGVLDVFSDHPEKKVNEKISKKDYFFILILGILGFSIIKYKTSSLGWLSWVISIIAGILIILLSILVLEDKDEIEKGKIKKRKPKITLKEKLFLFSALSLALLSIISFIIGVSSKLSIIESYRIIFGAIFVLFLPGFIISYIFFPKNNKKEKEKESNKIDLIERIALSFALSIAIVPLIIFYLNLIGLKISALNSFLTILGIVIISLFIISIKNRRNKY